MKKILLILFLIVFVSPVYAEELEVSLVKCVDGDTAVFLLNEEEIKFRFLAIDTPETKHPEKNEEEYGVDASTYTCNMLSSAESIMIEYDEKGTKTDKYGRHLVWVYVDGTLLQEELVSRGLAEVSYIYYKYEYVPKLCDIQKQAREDKLGIWSLNREEGYCSTKTNKKSDTTNKTTTKVVSNKNKKRNKIINYMLDGKFDKALKLLIEDTENVLVLIVLIILFIIFTVYKKKRKKKNRK